jgi:thioredoxin 1
LSKDIKCTKCGIELNSEVEFEKHVQETKSNLSDSPLEVDVNNWKNQVLQSTMPTVVEFWHENCPGCKSLASMYNEVAKELESKIKFTKLNVLKNRENRELAIKYGLTSTPTLILFCDGKLVATKQGVDSKTKNQLKQLTLGMLSKCSKNK